MRVRDWRFGFLLLLLVVLVSTSAFSRNYNGFDLRGSLVPVDEIHLGGPSKDGIPAIDRPKFVSARKAGFLKGKDQVLGLVRNGVAKAYPVPIMNWHEIVNDEFGGERVAVTYCPLCGTGVAFKSSAGGKNLSFGVSGLLYNSDVLLYDRETESLWSQLMHRAITGSMKGRKLEVLPLTHTTWRAWRREHPGTQVLSTDTGYRRDYNRDPYSGYEQERRLYFPVSAESRRYHPKERILGLEINGKYKAYPFAELARTGKREIPDNFNGQDFSVRFDRANESARIIDASGSQLPAVTSYWFAWYAFHPQTEVFRAKRQ